MLHFRSKPKLQRIIAMIYLSHKERKKRGESRIKKIYEGKKGRKRASRPRAGHPLHAVTCHPQARTAVKLDHRPRHSSPPPDMLFRSSSRLVQEGMKTNFERVELAWWIMLAFFEISKFIMVWIQWTLNKIGQIYLQSHWSPINWICEPPSILLGPNWNDHGSLGLKFLSF